MVWNCSIYGICCGVSPSLGTGKRFIMTYHGMTMYRHSGRIDVIKYISMVGMLGGLFLILLGIGII